MRALGIFAFLTLFGGAPMGFAAAEVTIEGIVAKIEAEFVVIHTEYAIARVPKSAVIFDKLAPGKKVTAVLTQVDLRRSEFSARR